MTRLLPIAFLFLGLSVQAQDTCTCKRDPIRSHWGPWSKCRPELIPQGIISADGMEVLRDTMIVRPVQTRRIPIICTKGGKECLPPSSVPDYKPCRWRP